MTTHKRQIMKKVRQVRRRQTFILILRRVLQGLAAVALLLVVLGLADRLFIIGMEPWPLAGVLAGAGALFGLIWAIWRRPTLNQAAIAADEKLNLRERISSALSVDEEREIMAGALIEDAASRARMMRAGDVFPIPLFREIPILLISSVAAALIWLAMPPIPLFANNRAVDGKTIDQKPLEVQQARQMTDKMQELRNDIEQRTDLKDPLNLQKIEKDLQALQKEFEEQKLTQTQALSKVSKLSDQVKNTREDMNEKLKDMQNLHSPENSKFTKDIAKDMQNGNFESAQEKMSDLKSKLDSGQLSEQDKQKLAEEMQKLAEQMKDNPALAEALKKAAQSMKAGDMKGAAEAMQLAEASMADLADALAQMEMLDKLDSELAACKSGLCQGTGDGKPGDGEWAKTDALNKGWKAGETMGKGAGMGGPGQGIGGVATVEPDKTAFVPDKVKGDLDKGNILASLKVDGEQIKGEARIQYEETLMEYRQQAEDTMEREPIPLEYRNLVSDYFDSINLKTRESTPKDEEPKHMELAPGTEQ